MNTVLHVLVAILTIVVVFLLLRAGHAGRVVRDVDEAFLEGLWEGECLSVVERIFDPRDYRWLRDKLGSAPEAESLRRARQRLALAWLKAMRRSFVELVRTPELPAAEHASGEVERGWRTLWLTLRFHLLVTYASLIVRTFGPYHRLVPFGWMRTLSAAFRKEQYGERKLAHLS